MDKKFDHLDAIVVGAGHAGLEAAFALANNGLKTMIIGLSEDKIGSMPCNPSIGGPAKGIITREIDALGGMQGLMADRAMIQIKMLNSSKGPAVHSLRAQIDKEKYSALFIKAIAEHPKLIFKEAMVNDFVVSENKIGGVILADGVLVKARVVILTTGTYMRSEVLRGVEERTPSGPDGVPTSAAISASLKKLGFEMMRLKTGTPPRVAASSIDFSQVEKETLVPLEASFSTRSSIKLRTQTSCYLTYTTPETHAVIREHLRESLMYSGQVVGRGPRYCPSIEDKVIRFSDKERHQIFYEPETASGDVIYVQGFSTAMPISVQKLLIQSLPGMRNAVVIKWAYAIEYDAINPLQLMPTLESKKNSGLFFAGQVNGTSGYEEAAAQGLMAGINAANKLLGRAPLILRRDEAYIGVLIDDLVTRGTEEPYRMLTSRAEYRLLLRHDNADLRLAAHGYKNGLITANELADVRQKYAAIEEKLHHLSGIYLSAKDPIAKKYAAFNGPSLTDLLIRPDVDPADIIPDFPYANELVISLRLEGYINKQKALAQKMNRLEEFKIPNNIDYSVVHNIATEARQKLTAVRPLTIGQALRISGVNYADVQMIMAHLEFERLRKNQEKK